MGERIELMMLLVLALSGVDLGQRRRTVFGKSLRITVSKFYGWSLYTSLKMAGPQSVSRRQLLELLGLSGIIGLAGCGGQPQETKTTSRQRSPINTSTAPPTATATETQSETQTDTPESSINLPWEQLPGPPGGPVTDIAISPVDDEYIFATTITAGLYASTDGGESWIQGPEARHHERKIVASPHDAETARTAFNRTTTAGRRWYDSNDPQEQRRVPNGDGRPTHVEYDPFEEEIRYAGTSDGLYRSVDGGINWEEVEINAPTSDGIITWVDASAGQPGVVYAAYYSDATVVRSDDHGESWQVVVGPDAIPPGRMRGLVAEQSGQAAYVCVDEQGAFRVSQDNGPEDLGPEISSDRRGPFFLFYDGPTLSADDERVYFHAHSLAEEEGASDMWGTLQLYEYNASTGDLQTLDVPERQAAVTAHPTDPEKLYFGGWSWVWESDDRGETWSALSNSFIDRYLSAVGTNPSYSGTVIPGSVCSGGVWVSHDSGQTFDWKRSGLTPFHDGEFAEHYVLYTTASGKHAYATTRAGLLLSEDNGRTWRLLETEFSGSGGIEGENPTPLHGLAIDSQNPEVVYVGAGRIGHGTNQPADFGGSLLWRSSDGGDTWIDISDGLPTGRDTVISQILSSQHESGVLYAATNKKDKFIPDGSGGFKVGEGMGVYRSPNRGDTWEQLSMPVSSVYNITEDAVDPQRLYASTQQGIYRTTDGGKMWERVFPERTKALLSHPGEPNLVFAGAKKYEDYWDLLVSNDGGASWEEGNLTIRVGREPDDREYDGSDLNADYRVDFGYIMDLAIDDSQEFLYAATRGAGLWRCTVESIIS